MIALKFAAMGYTKKEIIREESPFPNNKATNATYWMLTEKGLKKISQVYAIFRGDNDGFA